MAAIPPVSQIYVTAHFDWAATSPWLGEQWQIGLRLAVVPKIGAPQMGDTFDLAPSAAAERKSVNGSYVAAAAGIGTIDFSQTWDAQWNYAPESFAFHLDQMKAVVEQILAYQAAMLSKFSSKTRLTSVKIAPISALGEYSAGASEFRLRTPKAGSGGGNVLPPELAIAQSVGADILGRRGRGRWYLGGLTADTALSPDGTVAPAYATAANAAAKGLIDGIQGIDNAIPSAGQLLFVTTSATATTAVRPSYVRMGNHCDAQRRRQHQVVETYTQSAL